MAKRSGKRGVPLPKPPKDPAHAYFFYGGMAMDSSAFRRQKIVSDMDAIHFMLCEAARLRGYSAEGKARHVKFWASHFVPLVFRHYSQQFKKDSPFFGKDPEKVVRLVVKAILTPRRKRTVAQCRLLSLLNIG